MHSSGRYREVNPGGLSHSEIHGSVPACGSPWLIATCRSYFTPLTGVLFTFPSRYWFTIGCQGVFSLIRWSGLIHAEFHVHRVTWDALRGRSGFRAPGSHGLRPTFPCRYASPTRLPRQGPATPERQVPPVWALPLSLATTHGITSFSFPIVTGKQIGRAHV